jgi:hypothetical protein
MRQTLGRHRPPPGRRKAPPDDRLQRTIQYSETLVIERKGCGVRDAPHARGMTVTARSVSSEAIQLLVRGEMDCLLALAATDINLHFVFQSQR